jgi:hypothetical protein
LPIKSWAHYAFLEEGLSTYGHKTSIIVESIRHQEKSIPKINLMRQLIINLDLPSSKPGEMFLRGAYRVIIVVFLTPSPVCSHTMQRWQQSVQKQVTS